MGKSTKNRHATSTPTEGPEAAVAPELSVFGPDPLAERLRDLIGDFIAKLVAEELDEALRARRYQRTDEADAGGRLGYRHTRRTRELATSLGTATIPVQRARLFDATGAPTVEWRSHLLPRYARRARAVDDAILLAYLSGANSRRIRGALRPLLQDAPLSKSAVSRVVRALKQAFDTWRTQRLEDRPLAYLFLDAIAVPVRTNRRVQTVPVLVALGVHANGDKELLGLMLMASESRAAWRAMVEDLVSRGLREPVLCVIDGNAGLRQAIAGTWPRALVQRCVVHKLRNLEAHGPKAALVDVRRDFQAITDAESAEAARAAYAHFVRTWQGRCEGVVRSLLEAGEELLTVYRFPKSQWKCLRTTNAIERLHEEFRRRIQTQASLPGESSVLYLLFGLYESGQIRMRRIDGWPEVPLARLTLRPDLLRAAA